MIKRNDQVVDLNQGLYRPGLNLVPRTGFLVSLDYTDLIELEYSGPRRGRENLVGGSMPRSAGVSHDRFAKWFPDSTSHVKLTENANVLVKRMLVDIADSANERNISKSTLRAMFKASKQIADATPIFHSAPIADIPLIHAGGLLSRELRGNPATGSREHGLLDIWNKFVFVTPVRYSPYITRADRMGGYKGVANIVIDKEIFNYLPSMAAIDEPASLSIALRDKLDGFVSGRDYMKRILPLNILSSHFWDPVKPVGKGLSPFFMDDAESSTSEILFHNMIPRKYIKGYNVSDDIAKRRLLDMGIPEKMIQVSKKVLSFK